MELEYDLPRLPARSLLLAGQYDGLCPLQEIDRLAGFAQHIEALHASPGKFMPVQSPQWVSTLLVQYILEGRSGVNVYQEFIAQPHHRIAASEHAA